jgi:hypothetical protein
LRAVWSAKGNSRQHSVQTLVDRYGVPSGGVRDLLIDYLGELKPSMDYGTLEGWAYRLVRLFWWEVLQINPVQTDLRIEPQVAAEWRERLSVTIDGQPRREIHSTLFAVRGMYRDLAEWSHDEPARWGPWVAPLPVSRHESKNASKAKRRQQARMQNRTRALTPLLPALVAEAVRRRDWSARLITAAQQASHGQQFVVDGSTFELHQPPPRHYERDRPSLLRARIIVAAPDMPPLKVKPAGPGRHNRGRVRRVLGVGSDRDAAPDRDPGRGAARAHPAVAAALHRRVDRDAGAAPAHRAQQDRRRAADTDNARAGRSARRSDAAREGRQ